MKIDWSKYGLDEAVAYPVRTRRVSEDGQIEVLAPGVVLTADPVETVVRFRITAEAHTLRLTGRRLRTLVSMLLVAADIAEGKA